MLRARSPEDMRKVMFQDMFQDMFQVMRHDCHVRPQGTPR